MLGFAIDSRKIAGFCGGYGCTALFRPQEHRDYLRRGAGLRPTIQVDDIFIGVKSV